MALDAITTPTVVNPKTNGTLWAINGREADASTAIEIKATPGAGYSLHIEQVYMSCPDADAFPHLQDEDDNVLFGPFYTTATDPRIVDITFKHPIKMVSNKALEIKAAAAGNIGLYIQGRTVKDGA